MPSTEILDRAAASLYSGLLSDACDRLGIEARALPPGLRPVWPGATLCGIARVMHAETTGWMPMSPYARQIEALDALRPGDLVIATVGGDPGCALWGELFSTAARARGARGVLVDGCVRDASKIEAMRFPVLTRDFSPVDSLGRLEVVPERLRTIIGGVEITTGDFVFGDIDGVVVVPAASSTAVLDLAFEKAASEDTMRAEIGSGSSLRDAFDRHGVL